MMNETRENTLELEQLLPILEEKGYPTKLKLLPRRIYVGSIGSFYGVTIRKAATGKLLVEYYPLIQIAGGLLLTYNFFLTLDRDTVLASFLGITAASVFANVFRSKNKKAEIEALIAEHDDATIA